MQSLDAKTNEIAKDIKSSNFFSASSILSCKGHNRITKFVLCSPSVLAFMKKEAPNKFGLVHLDDKALMLSSSEDAALLVKAAERYIFGRNKSHGNLPTGPFYGAGPQFLVLYTHF